MSIAWSTIAFLVLLLPGFLFLLGIYLPENFTRETAPRSALGQLAATVLVALVVHGSFYSISQGLSFSWLPSIDLKQVFHLLQVAPLSHAEFDSVISGLEKYRWWILGYTVVTSVTGLALGREVGCLIVGGPLRRLAEHSWVYDLRIERAADRSGGVLLRLINVCGRLKRRIVALLVNARRRGARKLPDHVRLAGSRLLRRLRPEHLQTVTVAYALTDARHDDRFMMYRGLLREFGISKDGQPLYLVLASVHRSYMVFGQDGSTTGADWRAIGSSGNEVHHPTGARLSSYLVLSGDHVLNVVFDRHAFKQTRAGIDALNEADAALSTS